MRFSYRPRINARRFLATGLVLTLVSSIYLTTLPSIPIASATIPINDAPVLPAVEAKEEKRSVVETSRVANEKRVREAYGKLPLSFEVNQGQTDPRVQFLSRASSYTLFLTSDEAVVVLKNRASKKTRRAKRNVLSMKLVGAKQQPAVSGFDEQPHKSNYFIGNDPAKWRTNVSNFGGVKYAEVYPGIDLIYRGHEQQQLEYDFRIAPGADPRSIVLQFDGAQKMRIDKDGALVLSVNGEAVRHQRPTIYQENGNERNEVSGRYRLLPSRRVVFDVDEYDANRPLIIDPVLSYSTYLGGVGSSVFDFGTAIAVDSAGSAYVTGSTDSTNFPVQNGFQPTHGTDDVDSFVTKFSPSGSTLVYSSFLGGNGLNGDQGYGIVVDSAGYAYLTGYTGSNTFPTTPGAYYRDCTFSRQPYVVKVEPSGSALAYSTCLRNSGGANALAVDSLGQAYITGYSDGSLPAVNALQPSRSGPSDAFIVKLNALGSGLLYSSYFGGSADDQGTGIAVDSTGNIYLTGGTSSTNLPRSNAYQQTYGGSSNDGFVAKFTPNGSSFSFAYSTYLGGNGHDWAEDLAIDSSGNAYVVGGTTSANFPTLNAYQSSVSGNIWNGFVTKFDVLGAQVYSTYLGGTNVDSANGVTVDSSGSVYVTGSTSSSDFPTVNPVRPYGGNSDAFVTKFDPSGASLIFSTHIGGSQTESGTGIALDSSGNAYVVGHTNSFNYPLSNAYQSSLRGAKDAIVFKISGFVGFDIRGRVTDALGGGLSGVTITLTGTVSDTKQTDANGEYAFITLEAGGNFTVTPSKAPYVFTPVNRTFNNLSTEEQADFTVVTHSISGRVTNASAQGASGILVSLTGTQTGTATTDGNGLYSFPTVAAGGSYTLTPSNSDYVLTYAFTPATRSFSNLNANQTGADFSYTTSTRVSLDPLADAHVQDGTPASTNFGTATFLQVKTDNTSGQRRDAYFKFDISPVRRSIVNAKLKIYAALSVGATGSVGTQAFSVSDTLWSETAITWNNKPALSTALGTASVTGTSFASYEVDVTTHIVNQKVAGNNIVSLALHNPANSNFHIVLHSREQAANKPQLVITTSDNSNAPPTVSITQPANGAPFAASSNIPINVSATDSDGTISKVEFYAGTSKIDTDTIAPYSIVWPAVATGNYALRAVATDNNGATTTSSVVNITVNPPNGLPQVSLTAPPAGLTIPAGGTIGLSATATDNDGTITKVDFFTGTTLIGTDTISPYTFTWTNVPAGAHSLTAVATDNSGGTAPSTAVSLNAVWRTGLSPAADAYVRDGSSASTNFGTVPELQVQQSATTGSNRETYLRFDLTTVSAITGAKLRLFGGLIDTSGTNVPAAVYPLAIGANQNWPESGSGSLTWNTRQPLGNALTTTTITDNVARWYEWDITSHIQSEKTAGRNIVTLVVKSTANSSPYITFSSKEAGTNQPQLQITTTGTRNVLLVIGGSAANTSEGALKTRMENLGFTVTVKQAGSNQNSAVNTVDAYGKAAVVISSTVTPANVGTKFRNVVVPVLLWDAELLDEHAMTGPATTEYGTTTAQTQITILDATHPLAAGHTGNVPVVASSSISWGKPSAAAAKVASQLNDAGRITIFGYETGAVMPGAGVPGVPAPARRVGFFLTDTNGLNLSDPQGKALFDAAIKWLTATIVTPVITNIAPTFGTIGTTVTITGYNFGDTQGSSAVTFNGVSASPTSWTSNTITAPAPAGASSGPVLVVVSGLSSNAITFTITVPPVDTDNDGLPDAWELQHFGNLNQGANDNPDGDELNNLQEYLQGRNPTLGTVEDSGGGVNLRIYTPLVPTSP